MEQFVRMLIHCGMPPEDMDMIHCGGRSMGELIKKAPFRVTQFTGSSGVAENLAKELHGKIRVEDAGAEATPAPKSTRSARGIATAQAITGEASGTAGSTLGSSKRTPQLPATCKR
jgi:acyl-CoA reductase-like NAD-dependent aldehyde dehydrogenase